MESQNLFVRTIRQLFYVDPNQQLWKLRTIAYSIRRECDETESTLGSRLNERRTNEKEGGFNSSKFVCTESDKIIYCGRM